MPVSRVADTLLISNSFFGYAKAIAALLEERGRRVLSFEDRPATDTLSKVLVRLSPNLLRHRNEAYVDRILAEVRDHAIRDVLVIKGEAFSAAALRRMRLAMPEARFTLYFWDSYRNMPKGSSDKVQVFDRSFTFDPIDARADTRLTYRPLFYLPNFRQLAEGQIDIDLLFLGTAHTDRYAVLNRLKATLPENVRFERILFYPSATLFRIRRILDPRLWGARTKDFIFKPLPMSRVTEFVSRSRIAVDVERAAQSGLTMRTIEMLCAGKKLVSTNAELARTDLYRPNNVAIIHRRNPRIEPDFLNSAFEPYPAALLERYSLAGWLDEVMQETRAPAS